MKVVKQDILFITEPDAEQVLWLIEAALRNCYKSEGNNPDHDIEKRDRLILNCIKSGHESALEHASFTFRVITNRGVSHEWVRHRIGVAYSQESTRYCSYGNDDQGITVIWPWYLGLFKDQSSPPNPTSAVIWRMAMRHAEEGYIQLLKRGCTPQEARGVLPNDLKTEIVVTMNVRSLRHFFKLRANRRAHPQIHELAFKLYHLMFSYGLGILFQDIVVEHPPVLES